MIWRSIVTIFDDLLRMQKHILSPREEELLAMASKATGSSANTFGLLTNTELKYGTIKDADGNDLTVTVPAYYDLIYSKDRRVRRDVYLALHRSYVEVQEFAGVDARRCGTTRLVLCQSTWIRQQSWRQHWIRRICRSPCITI